MPLIRRRRQAKKKAMLRRRRQYGGRRTRPTGQSQVFSETQKVGTECLGVNAQGEVFITAGTAGQGVKLLTSMNVVPQSANYRNLWSAYKILKAKFTIIPKFTSEQQNEAALGTAAAIGIKENTRFAQAINDMNDQLVAPLGELDVLQDNGCRVKLFNKPMTISVRPKPLLEQTGGTVVGLPTVNVYQNRGQWIEFDGAGSTVQHVGIDGWFTAFNSLSSGFIAIADVYCTVSFVCKDPR